MSHLYNSLDEMLVRTIDLYNDELGYDVTQKSKKRDIVMARCALINVVGGFMPIASKSAEFFNVHRTSLIRMRERHNKFIDNGYYRVCLTKAVIAANYTGVGIAPLSLRIKKDVIKLTSNGHLQETA